MAKTKYEGLEDLTSGEVLDGILVYAKIERNFPDEKIYKIFKDLRKYQPERFNRKGIEKMLAFMEMGSMLIPMEEPNFPTQIYSPPDKKLKRILKRSLEEDGILPKHEALLRNLAKEFEYSLRD